MNFDVKVLEKNIENIKSEYGKKIEGLELCQREHKIFIEKVKYNYNLIRFISSLVLLFITVVILLLVVVHVLDSDVKIDGFKMGVLIALVLGWVGLVGGFLHAMMGKEDPWS